MILKPYKTIAKGRGNEHTVLAVKFDGSIEQRNAIRAELGPIARIVCGNLHVSDQIVRQGEWVVKFRSGWCDVATEAFMRVNYKALENA